MIRLLPHRPTGHDMIANVSAAAVVTRTIPVSAQRRCWWSHAGVQSRHPAVLPAVEVTHLSVNGLLARGRVWSKIFGFGNMRHTKLR